MSSVMLLKVGGVVARNWEPDCSASFARRLGKSAEEDGKSEGKEGCPDIWLLDNGDVAVIGRDHTITYREHLPEGVSIAPDDRLVVIPGSMLRSAKPNIPDA